MTIVTLILSMVLALLAILGDKGTEVLKKRADSPVKAALAYTIGLSVFGFIITLIVLTYVIYVRGVTIVGDIGSTTLLTFLIALVGISLGVFLATITRTETQALGLFGLILILQVIFSGLLIPISKFDYYTQLISYCLQLTYGLDAMNSVLIRGFTLGDVAIYITALAVIFVVTLVLSMVGLKMVQKSES